jgi:hypothetical protein
MVLSRRAPCTCAPGENRYDAHALSSSAIAAMGKGNFGAKICNIFFLTSPITYPVHRRKRSALRPSLRGCNKRVSLNTSWVPKFLFGSGSSQTDRSDNREVAQA